MRLTNYSDYALRILIYLATVPKSDELSTIADIAKSYRISKSHLTKIVFQLARLGYIESFRGKNGGIRLAMLPHEINLGTVLRHTESDFYIVPCFTVDDDTNTHDVNYDANHAEFTLTGKRSESDAETIVTQHIYDNKAVQNHCVIQPACLLRGLFAKATQSFIKTLEAYTLADVTSNNLELKSLL